MTQERIVERKTVTESSPAPRETVEKDYVAGVPLLSVTVFRSTFRSCVMAGSPVVAAGRPTPVAHPSVLSTRDGVMTVRHVPGHRDEGTHSCIAPLVVSPASRAGVPAQ